MAEPEILFGKNRVLLFRKYDATAEGTDAAMLVFQTEHTFTYNRELDRIQTKSGTVVKVGGLEAEVSIDAIQAKEDPTALILEESVINGTKMELWEVTIDEDLKDEDGKYPAVYARGYLDSWETGSNVEDESTVSSTFIVEKVPQKGFTEVSVEIINAAQYAFEEAIATPAGA